MQTAINLRTLALWVLILGSAPIAAEPTDFQTGLEAYKRGDFAAALSEWRPLAEQGDATAQLGLMYDKGEGVPQDDDEAVKWYRKAADQGDASAQNNLGLMYEFGRGVRRNYTEAVRWYRKGNYIRW